MATDTTAIRAGEFVAAPLAAAGSVPVIPAGRPT